jgi:hypothetical protein
MFARLLSKWVSPQYDKILILAQGVAHPQEGEEDD